MNEASPPRKRPAVFSPTGRYRQPRGKGPNGRSLCRYCHEEVPKGRSSWCSKECYKLGDWGAARHEVWKRDRGVCALCGLDCHKLASVLRKANHREKFEMLRDTPLEWVAHRYGVLYEVDHILPKHLGGTHDLDNLRTLCVPCHKRVTAEQAAARAKQKKELS